MTDNPHQAKMDAVEIDQILNMIPHRYPFLLVDRVTDIVPNQSATGIKNVTVNEPHFQGHFPGKPIMPGVLLVEAMAQTACVLVSATLGEAAQNKLVYFMGIESARFRRPVAPGDTLSIQVEKQKKMRQVWRFSGTSRVGTDEAASADFTASLVDRA